GWDFEISDSVTILDNVLPLFSNAVNTSVDFKINSNFTANITVDNEHLDTYNFSTNASGGWVTVSRGISGQQWNASENVTIDVVVDSEVCWFYWANDTTGNSNQSDTYCFTVVNTVPVISQIVIQPGAPNTTDDLNCTYSASDDDSDDLFVSFDWYVD
ncbi:unnamed protein product, partial [marine sediment metagenome]